MTIFANAPFRPAHDTPLYQQLYSHMRTAILSGELKGGTKLPSTRALGDELGLSRNTIINAYAQLMAEGYLESITGSGTFVARVLPENLLTTPRRPRRTETRPSQSRPPRFSENATAQLATPQMSPPPSASTRQSTRRPPLNSGLPALDEFPYDLWSRLVVRQARRMPNSAFPYQEPGGYGPLREAIAAHVTISRRVHCTPEQVVMVSGSQGALDLASRMLISAGDPVWLEDPGYLGARGAFAGVGAKIIPVPVDQEGLVVEAGIARAPQARVVYITPSHQFPMGVTMSLSRRLALLEWAKRADAYILEDDYDSEYRFAGRPLAALQGLDDADRVIYIGTFSKVLFPALRIGYLILPRPLVEPFLSVRRLIDIHPPMLEQAVLCDFITEGHFTRHLRRMRVVYAERRAALLEGLRSLPLEIFSAEAGIHCLGWLPEDMDELALIQKAAAQGIDLTPLSKYAIEPMPRKGLLMSYGGYSVPDIRIWTQKLAEVMRSM